MKKILTTNLPIFFALGLASIIISACSLLPQINPVEGQERDSVIALANPLADNLFQGMGEGNYALFSRDFDTAMKKALDEKAFNEMVRAFTPKIGLYQSREVEKVELVDTVYAITYLVKFEKEDAVSVRLSVRQGDPPLVAGLYFDSPKLRER